MAIADLTRDNPCYKRRYLCVVDLTIGYIDVDRAANIALGSSFDVVSFDAWLNTGCFPTSCDFQVPDADVMIRGFSKINVDGHTIFTDRAGKNQFVSVF